MKARLLLQWILKPIIEDIVSQSVDQSISRSINQSILKRIQIWGDPSRLKLHPTTHMVNTLFNTSSGLIEVGEYSFTGHNVAMLTGTHDYRFFLQDRMTKVPRTGRDILIGKGVWIGSNAVILGPCIIGDHAVVAAGSVVTPGTRIDSLTIYGGIPARHIKSIDAAQHQDAADWHSHTE